MGECKSKLELISSQTKFLASLLWSCHSIRFSYYRLAEARLWLVVLKVGSSLINMFNCSKFEANI